MSARRRGKWGGGVALLAALTLSTGCMKVERERRVVDPYAPGSPLLASPGTRLVISGSEGAPLTKWRERRTSTKIYDARLAPVGTIREREGHLEVRPLAAGEPWRVGPLDADEVAIGEVFSLERREEHLVLFDASRVIVAVISPSDPERVELRDAFAFEQPPQATARRTRERVELRRGEQLVASAPTSLSPAALIAFAIEHDELDALSRGALARALERVSAADR